MAGYQRARGHVLTALANDSRPGATLHGGAEVDPERHSARVSWTIDPGPSVTFGAVTISGLDKIDPQIVQRELTLEAGQTILAGSFTRPVDIRPGDEFHFDFGDLDGFELAFT